MIYYVLVPIVVGLFALAAAIVGIRRASIGQHIGAAFFIGGGSGIASTFISYYFSEADFVGGHLLSFVLSILATWIISYLLVNVIYVADERQAASMSTIVCVLWGIGFLFFVLSKPG